MKLLDYECKCGFAKEELVEQDEKVKCPECGSIMKHLMPCPHKFTTIQVTHNKSGALKAGSCHRFVNRSAEKIQSGVGGVVSPRD